jgi:AcrR family transcriptional regulator
VTTEVAPPPPSRGTYPKGRARREEILDVALELFSEQGYRSSSIREIARRVGLTQTGVMHHFDTKEELLMEVLARRDSTDEEELRFEGGDLMDLAMQVVTRNAATPGIVRLFTVLSAEATDPEHPAHKYFAERYRSLADRMVVTLQENGTSLPAGLDAHIAARLLLAMMDGLQIQWLLCNDFTMVSAFQAFLDLLAPGEGARTDPKTKGSNQRRPKRASSSSK